MNVLTKETTKKQYFYVSLQKKNNLFCYGFFVEHWTVLTLQFDDEENSVIVFILNFLLFKELNLITR
jgi:hypothetical protein